MGPTSDDVAAALVDMPMGERHIKQEAVADDHQGQDNEGKQQKKEREYRQAKEWFMMYAKVELDPTSSCGAWVSKIR